MKNVGVWMKAHPSEWLDVRFALITLEEEIKILFEEIPVEKSNEI